MTYLGDADPRGSLFACGLFFPRRMRYRRPRVMQLSSRVPCPLLEREARIVNVLLHAMRMLNAVREREPVRSADDPSTVVSVH